MSHFREIAGVTMIDVEDDSMIRKCCYSSTQNVGCLCLWMVNNEMNQDDCTFVRVSQIICCIQKSLITCRYLEQGALSPFAQLVSVTFFW